MSEPPPAPLPERLPEPPSDSLPDGLSAAQIARFRRDLELLTGAPPAALGIAVSGGGDSVALLRLAQLAYPGVVLAATVDHGLRAESRAEALHVAAICEAIGCPHAILDVDVPLEGEGLQAAARKARYLALEDWAKGHGIAFILTAHHADDQAETLLMRLVRGAGLAGLAGVRASRNLPGGVRLVRPLLGWRRSELARIAGPLAPVTDPSNADLRFDRVRMRSFLGTNDLFDPIALSRSATALAQCEEALDWIVDRLWGNARHGDGVAFDARGLPAEIKRRMLLRTIEQLSGGRPRGDEVQRLIAALDRGEVATLSGVKCIGGLTWSFALAPPRRGE